MSSAQHLRDFIRERLTAAAEEIFTEVEKTIICYEEQLDAQRRMMGINWKPQIKLNRIGSELQRQSSADVLQQHVWMDEKDPMQKVQKRFEGTSSLDREEPEASQIKNEPEELCSRQEPVNLLEKPSGQDRDFHEVEPNTKKLCHNYSSLTCDVCGKTFKSKYNSQVHHRMHLGLKPFVCTVCGKGFSQKTHLKGHISIHTGEWPFYCKICGRGCVDRRRLNNHMRTHSREKSFTCEICGIGFTLLSSLNSHLRKHNRERLFSCPTCGKIFTRKVSLKAHMWVHTDLRTGRSSYHLVLVYSLSPEPNLEEQLQFLCSFILEQTWKVYYRKLESC
ncbi:fez family zinc finger protein 1-like isoform X1 [Xiphophorus maculatus]|uniref:fez family zinc finger protein 1-like isoform X1 n=1 Tax=Xiphophorus maculatus TaxID=8083 RepID=UPI000C6DCF56|nr:fez family zinc finger protein 1-like isoform X1 [Xiphophorus maculatus]